MFGAIDGGRPPFAHILREVVAGDGSTGQGVCVHGVAKLVNLAGGSKLCLTPLLCRHYPPAACNGAGPRLIGRMSCVGSLCLCYSAPPLFIAAAGSGSAVVTPRLP